MKSRSAAVHFMAWFLILGSLAGCDGPVDPNGSAAMVSLAVQASTSGSDMVEVITIEVTGAGIPVSILVNLDVVDGSAAGTVVIPPGNARTFTGRGFDAQANITHEGTVVTNVRPGQAAVRIRMYPRGVGVPIEVTVGAYAVSIAPAEASVEVAGTFQFAAMVTDAEGAAVDNPVLTWGSSNPAFATVNGEGLVTGVYPGTARIVVSFNGVAAESLLTVVAAAVPTEATILAPVDGVVFEYGEEITFSGVASDGSGSALTGTALEWTSDIDGLIGTGATFARTDLSGGTHTITLTATDANARQGSATAVIEVNESSHPPVLTSIVVLPGLATTGGAGTEQFTATAYDQYSNELSGIEFTWSSSSPCIASVDAAGLATTLGAPGDATIRASAGGISGSATYRVTHPAGPAPASVTGAWLVCFRDTGAHHSTLDLVHEEGSEDVAGSITLATGLTRSLYGYWRSDALTIVWSQPVRLSETTFFINSAVARSESLLQGEYVDGVQFLHRDVDIVRVVNDD